MEGYIAEIRMYGSNFAPRNWAFCNGQILSIAQNTALFSLIGTTYGGNGQTTFALPDLRGRVPMHWGQGPGRPNRSFGEQGGQENATLLTGNLPAHNHPATMYAESKLATSGNPTNAMLGVVAGANTSRIYSPADPVSNTAMHTDSVVVGNTGSSQPFSIVQPFMAISFIICLYGIYPSRS